MRISYVLSPFSVCYFLYHAFIRLYRVRLGRICIREIWSNGTFTPIFWHNNAISPVGNLELSPTTRSPNVHMHVHTFVRTYVHCDAMDNIFCHKSLSYYATHQQIWLFEHESGYPVVLGKINSN